MENNPSQAQQPQPASNSPLNKLPQSDKNKLVQKVLPILAVVIVIFAGVGTGKLLSSATGGSKSPNSSAELDKQGSEVKKEAGLSETEGLEGPEEGVLKIGDIEGEGTHYLDRNAGEEKYIYMTSSVINLDNYADKKVQIWGETLAAKHAPWLMDVVRIKIIE